MQKTFSFWRVCAVMELPVLSVTCKQFSIAGEDDVFRLGMKMMLAGDFVKPRNLNFILRD